MRIASTENMHHGVNHGNRNYTKIKEARMRNNAYQLEQEVDALQGLCLQLVYYVIQNLEARDVDDAVVAM